MVRTCRQLLLVANVPKRPLGKVSSQLSVPRSLSASLNVIEPVTRLIDAALATKTARVVRAGESGAGSTVAETDAGAVA